MAPVATKTEGAWWPVLPPSPPLTPCSGKRLLSSQVSTDAGQMEAMPSGRLTAAGLCTGTAQHDAINFFQCERIGTILLATLAVVVVAEILVTRIRAKLI